MQTHEPIMRHPGDDGQPRPLAYHEDISVFRGVLVGVPTSVAAYAALVAAVARVFS